MAIMSIHKLISGRTGAEIPSHYVSTIVLTYSWINHTLINVWNNSHKEHPTVMLNSFTYTSTIFSNCFMMITARTLIGTFHVCTHIFTWWGSAIALIDIYHEAQQYSVMMLDIIQSLTITPCAIHCISTVTATLEAAQCVSTHLITWIGGVTFINI